MESIRFLLLVYNRNKERASETGVFRYVQHYSDEQLMELIKAKQSEALHALYDRYARLVYSFAMKARKDPEFARDVVQLVYTRIWTTESGYDPAKGLFVNWLLTVTRNLTIDQLRKLRKQSALVPLEHGIEAELGATEVHPFADPVSRKLFKQQLEEAYRYMSEQQIELIRLFYWEGYTLSEIAEMLEEPLGTVKSRLHQSLKLLRKHMTSWREE